MRTTSSLALFSSLAALALGCSPAGLGGERPAPTRHEAAFGVEVALAHAVDISVWSGRVTDSEMDCFWDHDVRHVIVGTQELGIARQQMEMAISRGMTVDAYVYLVWSRDMHAQVAAALDFARRYPVGMLWLDIEEAPAGLGRGALEDRIQDAVDACGDFPCGIYTAGWWWAPNMGSSAIVADLPLWYANYDGNADLASWSSQRVGAWDSAWGKQYAGDLHLCGIDVDLNTIGVTTTPTHAHPSAAPPSSGVPAAPSSLSPSAYELVPGWLDVRLLSGAAPGATSYDFAIEVSSGAAYGAYYTYTSTTNARSFSPRTPNVTYRFRVRARNGAGAGPWSGWSYFQYGSATAHPPEPGATEPPAPPPSDPPPAPPPSAGSLTPTDGARITTGSVTMTRGAATGATTYTFAIEYDAGGAYAHYYDYVGASASRTFWPTYTNTAYRWRVRAGSGAWSSWATFLFGAGATLPGTPPSDPPPAPPPSDPPTDPGPAGAPTGLTPSGGLITTGSVTLGCTAVTGATHYEFAIDVRSGTTFAPYFTYSATSPTKTFYPATHGTAYRFRVRAQTASGWSEYSSYATFDFR